MSESEGPTHRIASVCDVELSVRGVVRVHCEADQTVLPACQDLLGEVEEGSPALAGHVEPTAGSRQGNQANLQPAQGRRNLREHLSVEWTHTQQINRVWPGGFNFQSVIKVTKMRNVILNDNLKQPEWTAS